MRGADWAATRPKWAGGMKPEYPSGICTYPPPAPTPPPSCVPTTKVPTCMLVLLGCEGAEMCFSLHRKIKLA